MHSSLAFVVKILQRAFDDSTTTNFRAGWLMGDARQHTRTGDSVVPSEMLLTRYCSLGTEI